MSRAAPVQSLIGNGAHANCLYVMHVSIHGRFRALDPELGVDADTGGQTKYVLELSRRLGVCSSVRRIDLLTRKVTDPRLLPDYARDVEVINERARIVRLTCGPARYIQKERLWPHLEEFVDNALDYIQKQGDVPDVVHGHYADGGFVATRIAKVLGIPLIFTAHSLGRFKRERLVSHGMPNRQVERQFHFRERIEAEEETLENADAVIASTDNEVDTQYRLYDHYDKAAMRVIPPGCNLDMFAKRPPSAAMRQVAEITQRFISDPKKPALVIVARPDEQKNVFAALRAFGGSELRKTANLYLFIGKRATLDDTAPALRTYYMQLLAMIDRYDLYGNVAYPKSHSFEMVVALLHLAAKTKGLLLAPSHHENFGLTLVEAAAAGVPVISSGAGGMAEVLRHCGHGVKVNPNNEEEFAGAIRLTLQDQQQWRAMSKSGKRSVSNTYSWQRHCSSYLQVVAQCIQAPAKVTSIRRFQKRFGITSHILVCDIDDTLTGDLDSLRQLTAFLQSRPDIRFGVATGRNIQSATELIASLGSFEPAFYVTSVGTRIHYNLDGLVADAYWQRNIRYRWQPQLVQSLFAGVDWLELQEPEAQGPEKISYYLRDKSANASSRLQSLLRQNLLQARVVVSKNRHVDVLPVRASKGLAVRYLSWRLNVSMASFLTAGDAGNDIDMLKGSPRGIVVANYSREVGALRRSKDVYFSPLANAAGILDGLRHYGLS